MDPFWYKDAVVYELPVRAFRDGDGDGVGDFRGLVERLDYLQDLGVTALWLLPFYPSPLMDDGYDIADYTAVHPAYGTLDDFTAFLDQAHRRGLRVITELVLNHTSDQHPWFRRARTSPPGSPERDFYVWSDTPERFRGARVIFQDFEASNWSWDPVAGAYYWHRFFSHQPDLNYANPAVRAAVFAVVDFWLGLGVDGLRLDAVPYLYEAEGTPSENLPPTHAFLKALRRHVDERYADRMLLAEANQWPEDAVAYFGEGDECHMAFHFPLMPRLYVALRAEDRLPVVDILAQTPPIPAGCQWALFLRNHDELTLEMVTDEERLYLYRAFAEAPEARVNLGIRRRLAPLLGNSRRRVELMNALLCSMPGTPVVYYGDEIGMGDNFYLGDRNGVRTPMQWSADRNAGFSRADPQQLYLPLIVDHEYHHATVHVEAQERNPHSLLHFTRRLLTLRRRHAAFGRGSMEILHPANPRVLAFVRAHADERILVVANLSRFAQAVELDLGAHRGLVPLDLFGRTAFWPIGDAPYRLTLGPHAFFWFALEPPSVSAFAGAGAREAAAAGPPLPAITTDGAWDEAVVGRARDALEHALPGFLRARPWFGGAARPILGTAIEEAVPVDHDGGRAYLTLVRVAYADGDPDTYLLPLAFVPERPGDPTGTDPRAAIASIHQGRGGDGVLVDAAEDRLFWAALHRLVARRRRPLAGSKGELAVVRASARRSPRRSAEDLTPVVRNLGRRSTSVFYGERLVLKLLRRIDEGLNPELEVGVYLTQRGFPHAPPVVGALEYRRPRGEPMTLAILQGFVPNEGDAWTFTLEALDRYLAQAAGLGEAPPTVSPPSAEILLASADQAPPCPLADLIGPYLATARLLGRRTAELHHALTADEGSPAFAPAPFTALAQRSLYQSMRGLTARVLRNLRAAALGWPEAERTLAEAILAREDRILARFGAVLGRGIGGARIRCHGDYHLGQVLRTGDDVVVVDFEGQPDRPVAERRLKAPPLRDVAGMLRSFHAAAEVARASRTDVAVEAGNQGGASLDAWAVAWYRWTAAAFLGEYRRAAGNASFLPAATEGVAVLLDALLLEQAVNEVGRELIHRPDWVWVPLRGLLQLTEGTALAEEKATPGGERARGRSAAPRSQRA